jgi:predicted nucleic acid-binding protein
MLNGGCVAGPESPPVVVCDAGPLIHLDELGCLDLLSDFREVLVPAEVWNEVARHRSAALRRRRVRLNRIAVVSAPGEALLDLARSLLLGLGELEALSLMATLGPAILLTDEAAARLAANTLGYEVHGTIGIVVRAARREQRTKRQVLNLLHAIPRKSTLFVTEALLRSIFEEVRSS